MAREDIIKISTFEDLCRKEWTTDQLTRWYNFHAVGNERVRSFANRRHAADQCKILLKSIMAKREEEERTEGMSDEAWRLYMLAQLNKNVDAAREANPKPANNHDDDRLSVNSEGVKASWSDDSVRTARMRRSKVIVTNPTTGEREEYGSVKKAFDHFNLPDSKHIKFRMNLKRDGKQDIEHDGVTYKFEISEE